MRSERRNGSTGLIRLLIGSPPRSRSKCRPGDVRRPPHVGREVFLPALPLHVLLHTPSARDSVPALRTLLHLRRAREFSSPGMAMRLSDATFQPAAPFAAPYQSPVAPRAR